MSTKYTTEKQIIEQTISILSISDNIKNRYLSEIELLKKRLAESIDNKYRVGVIGVTSSGKSTMINAVLGEDLLCMDVRASSSQLVPAQDLWQAIGRRQYILTVIVRLRCSEASSAHLRISPSTARSW